MFFVYLLKSKTDKSLYIGSTNDLKRRLTEHNQGLSKYTNRKIPLELIYCEVYKSKKDALIRERKLKGFKNSYTELKKRLKFSLN